MSIEAGIIEKLILILTGDDLEVRKEAIWALSNTTQNASPQQFQYMAERNGVSALASVLDMNDSKSLIVAMEGLENLLKCGKMHFLDENGENKFALLLEMCGGVDKLEALQTHKNQ